MLLEPIWWSFGSGSRPRHISLGAGAPPNSRDGGAASTAVIEELEPFLEEPESWQTDPKRWSVVSFYGVELV